MRRLLPALAATAMATALSFAPGSAFAQAFTPPPTGGGATPGIAVPAIAVPVLDRAIAKGDVLAASDFITQEMPLVEARAAPRLRDIVGMEAARSLMAGTVVRSSDLIRPQLVRRGEPVMITLRHGGLSISTAGRALGSGAAGDFVRIVSLSTNRTLDCVVESTGVVRVSTH